ncbi:hypothetical protein [Succinimonas amylolytica]|uniref:hypothetical protein n=1 Tax=Succinimonas amylolytica TaxID=83769 RepID=UPI0003681109|nr:hypothetical protein [Succinimonas amylolytica]
MTVFLFVLATLFFLLLFPVVMISLLNLCALRSKLEYPALLSKEISQAVVLLTVLAVEGGIWFYMHTVYSLAAEILVILLTAPIAVTAFRKSRLSGYNSESRSRFLILGILSVLFLVAMTVFVLKNQGLISW